MAVFNWNDFDYDMSEFRTADYGYDILKDSNGLYTYDIWKYYTGGYFQPDWEESLEFDAPVFNTADDALKAVHSVIDDFIN